MQDVSAAMIREQFAQVAPKPITLMTLHDGGLYDPVRLCDWPGRLPGSSLRGVVSRGETFYYLPLRAPAGVSAGADAPVRDIKLVAANADGGIARALRATDPLPLLDIEEVRQADPDTVEIAIIDAEVRSVDITRDTVELTFRPKSFADTPAVFARYGLHRTPALG